MTPETVVAPLPDFFSPVFVKELRQGLRAHRFVLPFVAAQIFAVLAVGTEFGIAAIVDAAITGGGASSDLLGRVVMWVLWGVIGVVMPLTSLAALRDELSDEKNVELLLMSNLNRWQIVRGKWLVGSALSGLIFVSMLPYILTRYFVGGLELPPLLFELCGMILANLVGTALAIGASGFRNLLGRFVLVGIGVLRACGVLDGFLEIVRWGLSLMGADVRFVDALPTALMKPFSGSGARSLMVEAMQVHGADSFAGRLACIVQGSTETTFYVVALYFGAVKIKNTRNAIPLGLAADLAGILTAIGMGYLFFG